MNEFEIWNDSNSEKNKLIREREETLTDIYKLRTKPYYQLKVGGHNLSDNNELTELIISFKLNKIKEIDKKLGI